MQIAEHIVESDLIFPREDTFVHKYVTFQPQYLSCNLVHAPFFATQESLCSKLEFR